jgi:ribosomal protein S18 acetylase RimI-like enzyme
MTVTIRHAGPGDEPDIASLVRELAVAIGMRPVADEHYVRRYLAAPDTTVLLAVDERATVGLLSFSTRPALLRAGDSGEIESLIVLPERRGEGIGTKLIRTAMRLMQDAGCVEIAAGVAAENTRAQRLYLDAGMSQASMRLQKHL